MKISNFQVRKIKIDSPQEIYINRKMNHASFNCPSGHSRCMS
jgi:hypothetical protein